MMELDTPGRPLLNCLPDETSYSLAARLHRLWGCRYAAETAQFLFGVTRAIHHDLPCGLKVFEQVTGGLHGTAREIALQRTLLQFYAPFLSTEVAQIAIETMASPSIANLKSLLGLVGAPFGASHPLRSCPECMAEDLSQFGWTYWHRSHQYPGVWACPKHGRILLFANVRLHDAGRSNWFLPSSAPLIQQFSEGEATSKPLQRFAQNVCALIDRSWQVGELNPTLLRYAFCRQLTRIGMRTPSGQLRLQTAATDYLASCRPLTIMPGLRGVPTSDQEAEQQLRRLFKSPKMRLHPLRWLLIVEWLFESADDFLVVFREMSDAAKVCVEDPSRTDQDGLNRMLFQEKTLAIELMREGWSASSVSAKVGIGTDTALRWAASAGIAIKSRRRILGRSLKSEIAIALATGADTEEVASDNGVMIACVRHVLYAQPELYKAWKALRYKAKCRERRKKWIELSEIAQSDRLDRGIRKRLYVWLRTNDRDWLVSQQRRAAQRRRLR